MLIKQFCEATGLTRETVRFYVTRGLLEPTIGSRPGNRYQVFDSQQVERARLIKGAQRLGFSLRQIAQLAKASDSESPGSLGKADLLREQIASLAAQETELGKMKAYLNAKLQWVEMGEKGPPPVFGSGRHSTLKQSH